MILAAVAIILVLVVMLMLIVSQALCKVVKAQRESNESFCRFADMVLFRLTVLELASKNAFGEEELDKARREVRIDRGLQGKAD